MGGLRPVVGVGAVVLRADRLLLVQRGRPPGLGLWSLPGGRLEGGETIAEGVARELLEETGLRGVVGPLCGIAERVGPSHHFVIHDHWVQVIDGEAEAVAADDAAAVRWAAPADLEELELVPGLLGFLDEHGVLARMARSV